MLYILYLTKTFGGKLFIGIQDCLDQLQLLTSRIYPNL